MVVMNSKSKLVCFATLVLLFFNAVSSANLLFQITADKNTLAFGEEATISIWAHIEEEVEAGNGLNVWQLDMVVDTDGVVQVNADPVLIAPTPIAAGSGWSSLNADKNGNIYALGVFTPGPTDSNTGIGGFSLLAQVTIEAIGNVGEQVTYELTDYTHTTGFFGVLRDDEGMPSYMYPDNIQFLPGNNVFTIVAPEPGSLLIMAVITGLAFRSRRIDSGK
ncbi:MAG: hypothetical protein PHQ35_10085 [Phycisphaerae bacterium]|nr:hypothetical protein [Phycisphaerae bacterium]MDD5381960.1 hypothetical protein [Phycisphaerae bacterium]